MIDTVSALYIDPAGPYPKLVADCWDETRDARLYDGPRPVVAHPPCGPWSKLRHMCTRQDPSCGPRAVEQVREFGGVLEHPQYSKLWEACGLPQPSGPEDTIHDAFGGYTVLCNQVAWGHTCSKPTWLYFVRVPPWQICREFRSGGTPTHCICTGPRQAKRLPVATKKAKRLTPPAFAEWLVSLAAVAS